MVGLRASYKERERLLELRNLLFGERVRLTTIVSIVLSIFVLCIKWVGIFPRRGMIMLWRECRGLTIAECVSRRAVEECRSSIGCLEEYAELDCRCEGEALNLEWEGKADGAVWKSALGWTNQRHWQGWYQSGLA